MARQNYVSIASADDLHNCLVSEGHGNPKPLDKLHAVVQFAATEACAVCDFENSKLQPKEIALQAQATMQNWHPLLDQLYGEVGNDVLATQAVVRAVQMINDPVMMVGLLLCLRDVLDNIDDEDLASACRSLPNESRAMQKFIEFLD